MQTTNDNQAIFLRALALMFLLTMPYAVNAGGACDPHTETLTQNEWKLISLPCSPPAFSTVDDIFGDDLEGDYDVNWVVYKRDESIPAYVKLGTGDLVVGNGKGYWIKTNMSGQNFTFSNSGINSSDIPLTGVEAASPEGCANSAGQCNLVGHPFDFDVCWSDVLVVDGETELTLADADPNGAIPNAGACQSGSGTCIMSRIAHKWTGAAYEPFDGTTPGMEGTLTPWDGFFVSANKPEIKLRIPETPGGPGLPCGPPARSSGGGWYIRLIAEAGALRDDANVFGLLPDSKYGYDSHDLQELEPFGSPYLTVVFPHDNWGPQAGAYSSDYRKLGTKSRADIWSFEVRASDPDSSVTLSWEGSEGKDRFRNATLIDLETGHNVPVSLSGSYTFKMGGESHRFRWMQNRH